MCITQGFYCNMAAVLFSPIAEKLFWMITPTNIGVFSKHNCLHLCFYGQSIYLYKLDKCRMLLFILIKNNRDYIVSAIPEKLFWTVSPAKIGVFLSSKYLHIVQSIFMLKDYIHVK